MFIIGVMIKSSSFRVPNTAAARKMFIFIVNLVLAVNFVHSSPAQNVSRIVGGMETTIDRFPWQLSLRLNGIHRCGASLISENRALSAAHCFRPNFDEIDALTVLAGSTLRLGDSGSVIIGVQDYVQHPNFNNATLENDIAVIFLQRKLVFSDKISPVNLPRQDEPIVYESTALIAGWGYQKESRPESMANSLQLTSVTIFRAVKCLAAYLDWFKPGMICCGVNKGGRDACQGDSGGALTQNGVQIGIISWGVGCGSAKYPGIYTSTALFRKWINTML